MTSPGPESLGAALGGERRLRPDVEAAREREVLEVGSAVPHRLEAELFQLVGDVVARGQAAGRPGRAPLAVVVGKPLDVGEDRLAVDVRQRLVRNTGAEQEDDRRQGA